MMLYPHPRQLSVLRRVRGLLVSYGQNHTNTSLPRLRFGLPQATALLHPTFRPSDFIQLSLSLIPLHPFRPMQNT